MNQILSLEFVNIIINLKRFRNIHILWTRRYIISKWCWRSLSCKTNFS